MMLEADPDIEAIADRPFEDGAGKTERSKINAIGQVLLVGEIVPLFLPFGFEWAQPRQMKRSASSDMKFDRLEFGPQRPEQRAQESLIRVDSFAAQALFAKGEDRHDAVHRRLGCAIEQD